MQWSVRHEVVVDTFIDVTNRRLPPDSRSLQWAPENKSEIEHQHLRRWYSLYSINTWDTWDEGQHDLTEDKQQGGDDGGVHVLLSDWD